MLKRGLLGLSLLLMVMVVYKVDMVTYSADVGESQKPVLRGAQEGLHTKLDWAVEMLDRDVLYSTGFEDGDELPRLIYSNLEGNRRYGGQSFTAEDRFSGNSSMRIEDTYTNGNFANVDLNGTVTHQDFSRASFTDRRYVENGADLSVSYRGKTSGKGSINFGGEGGPADYGAPIPGITFAQDVKEGDREVKVNDPLYFKRHLDRGSRYYLANQKGRYNHIHVVSVDVGNSTITLNAGFQGEFKSGDSVLRHTHVAPVNFGSRSLDSKNGWELFNVNTKVQSKENYDTLVRGFLIAIHTTTHDEVYIDDLKIGHATKAQLYRGGTKLYEGYLSDYEDKEATDKEKPNPVEGIEIQEINGKQIIKVKEPEDKGTDYVYTVNALAHDGTTIPSDELTVNVESGIAGYSYVMDSNPTTDPGTKVNSTTGEVDLPAEGTEDNYLHIRAVDKAGNISEVKHIKLQIPTLKAYQDGWGAKLEWAVEMLDEGILYQTGYEDGDELPTLVYAGEDNAGNITTKNIVVDNIDKEAPTMELVQNPTEWTSGLVEIEVITEDKGSGLSTVKFNNPPDGNEGRNLMKDSKSSYYELYLPTLLSGGTLEIIKDGRLKVTDTKNSPRLGVMQEYGQRSIELERGNLYTLSFDVRGNVQNMNYLYVMRGDVATNQSFGINLTTEVKSETEFQRVEVTHRASADSKKGYIMIATQYPKVGEWFEVKGIKLEEGGKGTPYTTAYEDDTVEKVLVSENGAYSFTATDKVGNQTTKEITVSNIDKVKPTVTIEPSATDKTHEDVLLTATGLDGGSGVKRIQMPDKSWVNGGEAIYTAKENGVYYFTVEDHAGNRTEGEYEVVNIDKSITVIEPKPSEIEDVELTRDDKVLKVDIDTVNVKDWRDGDNVWRLEVSATPMKMVGGNYTLPTGTMKMQPPKNIIQLEGEGDIPTRGFTLAEVIDRGRVMVLNGTNARGNYEVQFPTGALEILLAPGTIRVDKVKYPNGVTPYESTITWEVISAP